MEHRILLSRVCSWIYTQTTAADDGIIFNRKLSKLKNSLVLILQFSVVFNVAIYSSYPDFIIFRAQLRCRDALCTIPSFNPHPPIKLCFLLSYLRFMYLLHLELLLLVFVALVFTICLCHCGFLPGSVSYFICVQPMKLIGRPKVIVSFLMNCWLPPGYPVCSSVKSEISILSMLLPDEIWLLKIGLLL